MNGRERIGAREREDLVECVRYRQTFLSLFPRIFILGGERTIFRSSIWIDRRGTHEYVHEKSCEYFIEGAGASMLHKQSQFYENRENISDGAKEKNEKVGEEC